MSGEMRRSKGAMSGDILWILFLSTKKKRTINEIDFHFIKLIDIYFICLILIRKGGSAPPTLSMYCGQPKHQRAACVISLKIK